MRIKYEKTGSINRFFINVNWMFTIHVQKIEDEPKKTSPKLIKPVRHVEQYPDWDEWDDEEDEF